MIWLIVFKFRKISGGLLSVIEIDFEYESKDKDVLFNLFINAMLTIGRIVDFLWREK